jgi:hypothetical protein
MFPGVSTIFATKKIWGLIEAGDIEFFYKIYRNILYKPHTYLNLISLLKQ